MEYASNSILHRLPRSYSRIQRLITVQELFLEYSLMVIILACFFLVSLSVKLFRHVGGDVVCYSKSYS